METEDFPDLSLSNSLNMQISDSGSQELSDPVFNSIDTGNLELVPRKAAYEDTENAILLCGNIKYKSPTGNISTEEKYEVLTTKNAVELLLDGTLRKKVCRYCLNVVSPLSELDQVLQIAGKNTLYKVTIKDMVASFHPFKVAHDPNFPNKICEKCLDLTISSYLFTQQCERSERALRNCFEDMYEKLEKLDCLDQPKKRGRQKLNPNYNTLYTEHKNVLDYAEPIINIINSGSELQTEPNQNKFECLKCWRVLPTLESLLNHEKIHPKSMWCHCRECGKSFPRRNLLLKHVQTAHVLGKQLQLSGTDFKCTQCGYTSTDYHQHLRHIEKHKFQAVMEHLLERDMDKLCAVCFNKDPKLEDMNKIICLHGGFPEMMGDKNIVNILGSTVPEKTPYKYQELLVPAHAKIIKIVKISKECKSTLKDTVEKFSLSPPIIISKDNLNLDNVFLFIFANPYNFQEFQKQLAVKEIIHKDNEEINTKFINDIAGISSDDIDGCNQSTKYVYVFSHPILSIEPKKGIIENIIREAGNRTGKLCWLYQNTCDESLKSNNTEKTNTATIDETLLSPKLQCKYCWIFKNSGKCEYCQKNNDNDVIIIDSKQIADETDTEIYVENKIVNESETNRSNKPKEAVPKKKKIAFDSPVLINEEDKIRYANTRDDYSVATEAPKKRKTLTIEDEEKTFEWQCQICLTVNERRETCVCCDAQRYLYKDLHVNFTFNKSFFTHLKIKEDTPLFHSNENVRNETQIEEVRKELQEDTNRNLIPQITEKDVTQISNLEKIVIPENFYGVNSQMEFNVDNSNLEEMEVVENNALPILSLHTQSYELPQTPIVNVQQFNQFPVASIPSIGQHQFQFHMGSTTGRIDKKIKRPIRRTAASFHK